jgi:hypothetical protein
MRRAPVRFGSGLRGFAGAGGAPPPCLPLMLTPGLSRATIVGMTTTTAAVKVHNGHEYRESGVPGLVIFGQSSYRNFALYVRLPYDRFVLVTHRDVNEWPTVRQAREAAQRIAELLPWDNTDEIYLVAQEDRAANELLVRTALSEV